MRVKTVVPGLMFGRETFPAGAVVDVPESKRLHALLLTGDVVPAAEPEPEPKRKGRKRETADVAKMLEDAEKR